MRQKESFLKYISEYITSSIGKRVLDDKIVLKKLEGTFAEELNEGDIIRFITENENEKVGYYIGSGVNVLEFSRNFPPPGYRGRERFTLVLELGGHVNKRRYNVLTPCFEGKEEREVATHYEILHRKKV